jgi:hypothetical protein
MPFCKENGAVYFFFNTSGSCALHELVLSRMMPEVFLSQYIAVLFYFPALKRMPAFAASRTRICHTMSSTAGAPGMLIVPEPGARALLLMLNCAG